MALNLKYKAEPTASKFHRSNAFVRGLRGPIGTGKSVACVTEIVRRAIEQAPFEGVRRSRWAAIRNTYPELCSTTIKTWQDWVDESSAPFSWDSPITSTFTLTLPDKTRVECEVMFIALDRPADVKKLKSLDLTGAWINEASELPKAVFDMATGRVGRYPSKAQGGSSWSGVILDTNSPDDDHWYYVLAETPSAEELQTRQDIERQLREMGMLAEGQPLYEWFAQPGALIKVGSRYEPNPLAENVANHELGYGYWLRQIPGKTDQWIKVFVLGQYGSVHDGKPVYSEFNDELHVKEIEPIPGVQLLIGMDFGLTPAAVIAQVDARGRLLVLDEVCGNSMGVRTFLEDILLPQLKQIYPAWFAKRDTMIQCVGDPAGEQRSQADEKTCFQEVKAAGLKIEAAETNAFRARRDAVAWFMTRLADGKPAFMMDPCCTMLRKGANGAYKYRRIQVVGEERYTDEPVKNACSHPHDGLQYVALKVGGIKAVIAASKPKRERGRSARPVLDDVVGM
jgi:hypothetical protein